ncbi:HD domain-containing protein [candidate division WOR-3 bacterium]|nr:HD domain-containing protein [candidate division WOR-3 bacterium]
MIVEDEVIVAEDLEMAITDIGYEVIGRAGSAEDAIKKAVELKPDLILMDIVLKEEKNGIDASHEIKESMDIPIIFLTAYSDIELINRAKSTGPYAYIVKPFQERQLLASIEIALYKSRMEKKLKESEEWFSTTLKSIGDAVITTDTEGIVTFMNSVAEVLTGCKQGDAVRKPLKNVLNIINEETGKRLEVPISKVLREGVIAGLESDSILIARDGTKLLIADSAAPIKNDKGSILGAVLVFRDITERRQAEKELKKSFERLKTITDSIVHAIALAVEMKDPYTAGHQRRVAKLACAIAREMGLPEKRIEGIRIAAILHDVGKIHVPEEILNKQGKLTATEDERIKTHPRVGSDILKTIDFDWPIAEIVLQHHERINKSGYPQHLEGQNIILEGKIVAVADVVEAMCSARPYRPAHSIEDTLQEISQNKGILYDTEVVDACMKLFTEKGFTFD